MSAGGAGDATGTEGGTPAAGPAAGVTQLIGDTPLIGLQSHFDGGPAEALTVWAKLESSNPGGSIKDRIALAMINEAEADGELSLGDTIVEATSGNTGIGLAVVAAERGYRLVLAMPEDMSGERQALFRWFGADLVLTPAIEGMSGAVYAVEEMVEEEGHFWPRQFENERNPAIHYETTGPEILASLDEPPQALVAGVGTGGTFTGTVRYLRQHAPSLKAVAVEPAGSPVLSGGRPGTHAIMGLGAGFVPGVLDEALIDDVITVEDDEALMAARRAARREGLLVGPSSGAALAAVEQAADTGILPPETEVVVVLPDTGERYVSMMGGKG